jgi:predicted nucleotidyltransferase
MSSKKVDSLVDDIQSSYIPNNRLKRATHIVILGYVIKFP